MKLFADDLAPRMHMMHDLNNENDIRQWGHRAVSTFPIIGRQVFNSIFLWNSLPTIAHSYSYSIFKSNLKTYIIIIIIRLGSFLVFIFCQVVVVFCRVLLCPMFMFLFLSFFVLVCRLVITFCLCNGNGIIIIASRYMSISNIYITLS